MMSRVSIERSLLLLLPFHRVPLYLDNRAGPDIFEARGEVTK